jgi:hypothetical protein
MKRSQYDVNQKKAKEVPAKECQCIEWRNCFA